MFGLSGGQPPCTAHRFEQACLATKSNSKPDRKRSLLRTEDMNDTEDYPGPTHNHPDKQGQDPKGRADEDMVKPPARPETETEEKKVATQAGNEA